MCFQSGLSDYVLYNILECTHKFILLMWPGGAVSLFWLAKILIFMRPAYSVVCFMFSEVELFHQPFETAAHPMRFGLACTSTCIPIHCIQVGVLLTENGADCVHFISC